MSFLVHIDDDTNEFYSPSNIAMIQSVLRNRFKGSHDRDLIVHPDTILSVMRTVYTNGYGQNNEMNDEVVRIIHATYGEEMEQNALGRDTSLHDVVTWQPSLGIRQTNDIKLSHRHPTRGYFNMNY